MINFLLEGPILIKGVLDIYDISYTMVNWYYNYDSNLGSFLSLFFG